MKKQLREDLKTLRTMLERPNTGQQLASILSALRGPDEHKLGSDAKRATTAVIRRKALTAANCYRLGTSNKDCAAFAKWRKENTGPYNHFISHAKGAFKALGLKWDEVNKIR